MKLENNVQVTITLSASELKDEQMFEAIQNLQLEAEEVDGVQEAKLIAIEEAPVGSKSLGGFLLNQFKALVELKKLPNLIKTLCSRLIGNQIIEVKAEGKGKKLEIKISKAEDLAKVMPEVNKFIDG
ncbi:MAG: hypothetical protein ACRC80_20875 [Waterburya sp.]